MIKQITTHLVYIAKRSNLNEQSLKSVAAAKSFEKLCDMGG